LAGLEALAVRQPPPGVGYPQVLADPGPLAGRTALRCLSGMLIGLVTFLVVTPVVTQLAMLAGWNAAGQPGSFAEIEPGQGDGIGHSRARHLGGVKVAPCC